ncbi:MAG: cyclopropane-fatty-acyl-phospholipid synthase family protein [Planctomycetota bacterium]
MPSGETYGGASTQAIQHHYDVGNDFYALWLDPTVTYSGALWDGPDDTLQAAQERKLDYHIDQARARGAGRVLEIGFGWGSMIRRLVDHAGVERVVGLTLSERQLAHVSALGDPRVDVRLENWFDHRPDAPYDAVISVAAFEAFARPGLTRAQKVARYRDFFSRTRDWLVPGGGLAIQTITWGHTGEARSSGFIESQVFPESDLPFVSEIIEAAEEGFEVVAQHNDRAGYERTCRRWLANLRAQRTEAVELVGPETVQRYETYLKMAVIGFHTGKIQLHRISFRREGGRGSVGAG